MPKHVTIDTLVAEITAQVEAGLLASTVLPGNPVYNPPPPTPRRIDNFNRTVASGSGFGNADLLQFGAWRNNDQGGAGLGVDGALAFGPAIPNNNIPPNDPSGALLVYGSTDQDVTVGIAMTPGDGNPNSYQTLDEFSLCLRGFVATNGISSIYHVVAVKKDGTYYFGDNGASGAARVTITGDVFTTAGVPSFPVDGTTHTLRAQLIGTTLKVAVDSDSDADLKTVSNTVPLVADPGGFNGDTPTAHIWAGIIPMLTARCDWIDFNYPGVFYNAIVPFSNAAPTDLVGVVAQSGQAFHGPTGLIDSGQQYGIIGPATGVASDCVTITAAEPLKDGCGVQLAAFDPGVYLVLKNQRSVTSPYSQSGINGPYTTGSALVLKADGIYYAMWGTNSELTEKLIGWPDASYNFTEGDQVFVIFNGDMLEVRKNNVVTITGFDYVTALTGATQPVFYNPAISPAEVTAIRESTDFGFSGHSGAAYGPFIVLP